MFDENNVPVGQRYDFFMHCCQRLLYGKSDCLRLWVERNGAPPSGPAQSPRPLRSILGCPRGGGGWEALLDHYGGEPARRAELYRRAMQLELAFFQVAWEAA